MKTKENVFVRINSKKEAKAAKRILKALGEKTAGNYWAEDHLSPQDKLIFRYGYFVIVGGHEPERTEVTLKELIQIIVSEKSSTENRSRANFLIKSEDGVDLYYDDDVCWVIKTYDKWQYEYNLRIREVRVSWCLKETETYRVFHSKENALKWIEEQNKPKELEVGKWYYYNKWLICYTGIEGGIIKGHAFNTQSNWHGNGNFGSTKTVENNEWSLASEQEVFEALKNEAVKRGFKEGVRVNRDWVGHGSHIIEILSNEYELYNNKILLNGWEIFNNGKWAEIIEEPEFITVSTNYKYPIEVYNDKIRIKCNGSENHQDNLIIRAGELEQIYKAYKSLKTN